MLKGFYVSSFKMLHDFELTNLSRINVVIGKSNSGKSTLFQSLMFYYSKNQLDKYIDSRFQGDKSRFFPFHDPIDITFQATYGGGFKDTFVFEHHAEIPPSEKELLLPFDLYHPYIEWTNEDLLDYFSFIEESNLKNTLLSLLRTMEKSLEDMYIINNELFTKLHNVQLPFSVSGRGFQRLFYIFSLMVSKKHAPFFLEFPEQGFHPLYLKVVIDFLEKFSKKYNRQLFISSYSHDFIDGFNKLFDKEENIMTVIAMDNGNQKEIQQDKIGQLRKLGLGLR